MIERLDHLNLRTAQLAAMKDWYTEVLGFEDGPRPDFGFPGAWMYANGQPLVHLVEVDPAPEVPGDNLALEHGAFSATGLAEFLKKLEVRGERHRISRVDAVGVTQVNVWDPDGNHLHIDFQSNEGAET